MYFSYLWNQFFFSSSVGIPNATILKYLGSRYSVICLIVEPLPAVSLPSNTTATGTLFFLTHSCSFNNSICNISFSVLNTFLGILDFSCSTSS